MKKLFVMGDSISVQYRPYVAQYTQGVWSMNSDEKEMEQALANLDNPAGLNGGDSSIVLKKLTTYREGGMLSYDAIVLNCGLHDIKRHPKTGDIQIKLEQYCENLRAITELLRAVPGRLYWVRTTPVEDQVHNKPEMSFFRYQKDVVAYNTEADKIMDEAGAKIIDLHRFTKNLGGSVYCDHVHYIEPVRQLQAAFIAGHLLAE